MQIGLKNLEQIIRTLVEASVDTGIAAATNTSLYVEDPAKDWADNTLADLLVEITGGKGKGQVRKIVSNTATRLYVTPAFTVAPDTTSTYRIGFFGKVSGEITQWAGVPLSPRDISLDLAELMARRSTAFPICDSVDVGTNSTLILDENPYRKYAAIINDSDTVIYLGVGRAARLNKGIRLNPDGGVYEINWTNHHVLAVYGIHGGTGTKRVCVVGDE